MLAILRAAEPKLYAYWAEGRVEAVARALFAHRTKGEYGSWEVAPHDAKVEDFAHALGCWVWGTDVSAGNTYRQARWAVLNPRQAWLRSKPVQWYQRARYGYSDVDMFDWIATSRRSSRVPRLGISRPTPSGTPTWSGWRTCSLAMRSTSSATATTTRARCREAVDLLAENFGGLWT